MLERELTSKIRFQELQIITFSFFRYKPEIKWPFKWISDQSEGYWNRNIIILLTVYSSITLSSRGPEVMEMLIEFGDLINKSFTWACKVTVSCRITFRIITFINFFSISYPSHILLIYHFHNLVISLEGSWIRLLFPSLARRLDQTSLSSCK